MRNMILIVCCLCKFSYLLAQADTCNYLIGTWYGNVKGTRSKLRITFNENELEFKRIFGSDSLKDKKTHPIKIKLPVMKYNKLQSGKNLELCLYAEKPMNNVYVQDTLFATVIPLGKTKSSIEQIKFLLHGRDSQMVYDQMVLTRKK